MITEARGKSCCVQAFFFLKITFCRKWLPHVVHRRPAGSEITELCRCLLTSILLPARGVGCVHKLLGLLIIVAYHFCQLIPQRACRSCVTSARHLLQNKCTQTEVPGFIYFL